MNYLGHYQKLINRARGRNLRGYCERHHIIPRCLGGSDNIDNLVDLTPEEHYISHQLLVKIHKDLKGTKQYRNLVYSVNLMSGKGNENQVRNNKSYGWIRREVSGLRKGRPPWNKGIPRTDIEKERISTAVKGRIPWNKNKKTGLPSWNTGKTGKFYWCTNGIEEQMLSIESNMPFGWIPGRLSASTESIRGMPTWNKGKKCPQISIGKIGRPIQPFTDEHRQKLSSPVLINDILYNSHKEAAANLNVHINTIGNWIKSGKAISKKV